jgi:hypothetical protein
MHGATFTFAQAILFTGKLQQHVFDITAFGDAVTMTTVGTGYVILVTQMHAGANGDSLLVAVHVNKARQLALLVFGPDTLFEFAYELH